ncbi:F-box/LRR-repeat protein 13-like [Ananas comosus]|uniref:F-box/LRR-repeat protein 13-like n=1 Tax=Ananas comosus TaxID=4615 RepID=A0A6P5ED44_ANACO|nr:F-box/LRR-repeat protein 13-like [Ananas comosus]
MEEPARKRQRLSAAAADRISALPDHLLHEILAFLPARLAVGTSLLSRRWRAVWTTAPDVSFTTQLSPSFVDSVLRHRDPALPLRSFSLVAASADEVVSDPDPDPALPFRSWILRADSPALQRLTLRLPGRFDLLPPAVFHLPSLKVLELRLPGRLDWPAAAFLPSLQRLELSDLTLLYPATEDAISNSCPALKCWRMSFESATPELEVKCPLLEVFELRTRAGPIGGLSICGCKIRKVSVRQKYAAESFSGPAAAAYLKLSAPGLQTLEWFCPLPRSATVDSLPDSLASSLMLLTPRELLDLDENRLPNYGHVLPLLRVDRLVLPHCWIIEEFSLAIFDRHDQENPRAWVHENLKHLELICFFEGFGSLGLAFLLKNFSKLETLRVSCVKESSINYAIPYTLFHRLFKSKGAFGRGGYWDSHNLSLKQLVQVSVHGFSGERFEYDFLEFLPRAAPSLRMITIYADSEEIVLEKVEQLQQSFPHIEILLQLHGR